MRRISMTKHMPLLSIRLAAVVALILGGAARESRAQDQATFAEARIFIEYNSSDNDLGFHVFLDGEDWKELEIFSPTGRRIFDVDGGGGYRTLGLTELFFEGAEPALDEFPLEDLLALFPEGEYRFTGVTIDGARLESRAPLTHAVPDGPDVSADVTEGAVVIRWDPVADPPEGFPDREITIAGFQVIVGSFQVTLPARATSVTLPPEFVASLEPGEHEFEVLTIEAGGNQTITVGSFETE